MGHSMREKWGDMERMKWECPRTVRVVAKC